MVTREPKPPRRRLLTVEVVVGLLSGIAGIWEYQRVRPHPSGALLVGSVLWLIFAAAVGSTLLRWDSLSPANRRAARIGGHLLLAPLALLLLRVLLEGDWSGGWWGGGGASPRENPRRTAGLAALTVGLLAAVGVGVLSASLAGAGVGLAAGGAGGYYLVKFMYRDRWPHGGSVPRGPGARTNPINAPPQPRVQEGEMRETD